MVRARQGLMAIAIHRLTTPAGPCKGEGAYHLS
jgi:hypothetical protein